jgi:hypothetical protein
MDSALAPVNTKTAVAHLALEPPPVFYLSALDKPTFAFYGCDAGSLNGLLDTGGAGEGPAGAARGSAAHRRGTARAHVASALQWPTQFVSRSLQLSIRRHMTTLRKLFVFGVAALAMLAVAATSASATTVVDEATGTKCGTVTSGEGHVPTSTSGQKCAISGHDVGGARFHDTIGCMPACFFDGTCDVELAGFIDSSGATPFALGNATISGCSGTNFTPCVESTSGHSGHKTPWKLTLKSATSADGTFCVSPGGTCTLAGMTITESGHNYTISDSNTTGEQACSNTAAAVNVQLAIEYDVNPKIEIK